MSDAEVKKINLWYLNFLRELVLEKGLEATSIFAGIPTKILSKIIGCGIIELHELVESIGCLLIRPADLPWEKLLEDPESASDIAIARSI